MGRSLWNPLCKVTAGAKDERSMVVPKSYPSEGQPRSTSDEFPSRVVFGNFR